MRSEIRKLGSVPFPVYSGTRVMMMPFVLGDSSSLPSTLGPIVYTVILLQDKAAVRFVRGRVGYLTIDEAEVAAGETHRRPGLHVDGVGPDGRSAGGWGGGGSWSANGMIVAASVTGSRGWSQDFDGEPGPDGDCSHLAAQCKSRHRVTMYGGQAYWCSPLAVHESLPMRRPTRRQFVRISMPSSAPWYEGYTVNPLGVLPTGPIHPRRAGMSYRESA